MYITKKVDVKNSCNFSRKCQHLKKTYERNSLTFENMPNLISFKLSFILNFDNVESTFSIIKFLKKRVYSGNYLKIQALF